MIHQPGTRVGALWAANKQLVQLLGYGVYEGDFVPESAAGDIAEVAREIGDPNPRIRLDNNQVVWGCECWWGPEEEIKQQIKQLESAGAKVLMIDIEEERKRLGR